MGATCEHGEHEIKSKDFKINKVCIINHRLDEATLPHH